MVTPDGNGAKSSAKKRAANRANALRSTGPRTPAGKERVSRNAVTHGLFTQDILIPGEDGEALKELGTQMRAEWQPVGVREDTLVEIMVACLWRLRRLGPVEAGIFVSAHCELLRHRAHRDALSLTKMDGDTSTMDELSLRIEQMPAFSRANKRQQARARQARAAAKEMERRAEEDTPTLGQAFIRGVEALSKLSRYETSFERRYYQALHELERLQRKRQGEHVPAPLAVDVTVTGDDATSNALSDQATARNEDIVPTEYTVTGDDATSNRLCDQGTARNEDVVPREYTVTGDDATSNRLCDQGTARNEDVVPPEDSVGENEWLEEFAQALLDTT
jgi:hypothetical protein